MSQNNNAKDELYTVGVVLTFIGAAAMVMIIFVFAVLAFVALALTIVCLFAWNSPVTLGKWTLMPDEARGFVYRGLIGSVLLLAFAVFIATLFGTRIEDTAVPYVLLGGYALGSIGLEIMMAQDQSEAPHQSIIPPSQQIAPPPREPSPPTQPFRFASWDDEDGR